MALTVGTRKALLYAPAASASAYDADAAAYFARMGTQESSAFKTAVNTAVVGWKALGAWSDLDYFGLFATHEPTNSLYDLRNASATWAVGGTTTHTPDRGISGNAVDGYIAFPGASLDAGTNYSQDVALVGVYCNQQNTGSGARQAHLGGTSAARTSVMSHDTGTDNGRINQTSDSTGIHTSTTRKGHRFVVRSGASAIQWFYNGTPQASFTTASQPPDAFTATVGRNGTAYCDDRFAFAWSGGAAWDNTKAAAFHAIAQTLATDLGAQY